MNSDWVADGTEDWAEAACLPAKDHIPVPEWDKCCCLKSNVLWAGAPGFWRELGSILIGFVHVTYQNTPWIKRLKNILQPWTPLCAQPSSVTSKMNGISALGTGTMDYVLNWSTIYWTVNMALCLLKRFIPISEDPYQSQVRRKPKLFAHIWMDQTYSFSSSEYRTSSIKSYSRTPSRAKMMGNIKELTKVT